MGRISVAPPLSDGEVALWELSARVAELEARLVPDPSPLGYTDEKLARIARKIYRTRQLRRTVFEPDLFAEPAWDMLLALFINRVRGVRVPTTSLVIAAGVPNATGLRWVRVLEAHGLLRRYDNPADRRFVLVEITDAGFARMRRLITEGIERCGLG